MAFSKGTLITFAIVATIVLVFLAVRKKEKFVTFESRFTRTYGRILEISKDYKNFTIAFVWKCRNIQKKITHTFHTNSPKWHYAKGQLVTVAYDVAGDCKPAGFV